GNEFCVRAGLREQRSVAADLYGGARRGAGAAGEGHQSECGEPVFRLQTIQCGDAEHDQQTERTHRDRIETMMERTRPKSVISTGGTALSCPEPRRVAVPERRNLSSTSDFRLISSTSLPVFHST